MKAAILIIVVLLAGCAAAPPDHSSKGGGEAVGASSTPSGGPPPAAPGGSQVTSTTSTSPPSHEADGPTAAPQVTAIDPFQRAPVFQGCIDEGFAWGPMPTPAPENWFPPGFSANNKVSSQETDGWTSLLDCQAIIIDNETVIKGVQFMFTMVLVTVGPEVPQGTGANATDYFVIEAISSNATVAGAFSAVNFPTQVGSIKATYGANGADSYVVAVAGLTRYAYQRGAYLSALQSYNQQSARNRLHDWNGTVETESWMDTVEQGLNQATATPALLTVSGGPLAAIAGPGGEVHGLSSAAHDVEYDFTIQPK